MLAGLAADFAADSANDSRCDILKTAVIRAKTTNEVLKREDGVAFHLESFSKRDPAVAAAAAAPPRGNPASARLVVVEEYSRLGKMWFLCESEDG